jgi:2-C-methyl-D-erythritol 4-phosphate cytidylyltransferase
MTCAALITAAGYGTRMGADRPKQYLDLGGSPLLARTVKAFEEHPLIDVIVITVPPGDETFCRSVVLEPYGFSKIERIVPGGATRQQSVLNGLVTLDRTDIVAIHDGARPLVSEATITKTIEAARTTGAALACAPVKDTVKRKEGRHLLTLSRTELWLAHTPQTFLTSLILEAHRAAEQQGFSGTDDSSLVERLGLPVAVVEDSPYNIKITTREDLQLARLLVMG